MSAAVRAFRAMGTDCEVTCYAPDGAAEALVGIAASRVEILEDCWSRFRPLSELNRLNNRAGTGPVACSPDLMLLVTTMRAAWEFTGGLFDPTILASIKAAGYDADFASVIARSAIESSTVSCEFGRAPGMAGIVIDAAARTIDLPAGVGIDPGAIGKGLAADVIVDELAAAGASGVLVNLGGDVAFAGRPGSDPAWLVAIEDERVSADAPDRLIRVLEFDHTVERGAVATSTTLKRRWGNGRHHLIDPLTGGIANPDLVQATVVDDRGWRAEAAATAALLMGSGRAPAWLDEHDLVSVLLTADDMVGAIRG